MTDNNDYADTFALMDTDHNGRIDAAEFTQLMQTLGGSELDPDVAASMFAGMDGDGDGQITLDELTAYLATPSR